MLAIRGDVVARPSREPSALSIDTRDDLSGACFVAIAGDRFDGHDFVAAAARGGAALAVIERPLSDAERSQLPEGFGVLRVASTRRALGQIAHAWRRSLRRLRVVAVTGSAGKTTTRRLLEGVLAKCGPTHASPKSFNNDIGVPLTLLATPDEARFLVAEVGMNHPGELVPLAELCEPEGCIVTLAGRAHLEGLGSVEGVATEKASILSAVPSHGFAIVNGDNAPLPFSGVDVANLGGGEGEDVVTGALGLELRPGAGIGVRAAYESPLTDNEDLYGYRWTASLVWGF